MTSKAAVQTASSEEPVSLALHARTRALQVTESVRAALLDGKLPADSRINEVQLARSLSVSRTPIRAALQTLAGEGLLDHQPNRGFVVRAFSMGEIGDAFEMRALSEGLICRLAAERGLSAEQDLAMREALYLGDELLALSPTPPDCRSRYSAINVQFHLALQQAADSRLLADVLRLCNRIPQTLTHNVVGFDLPDIRRRHENHHKIYHAVLLREPKAAETLMRAHIVSLKASLMRVAALASAAKKDDPADETHAQWLL
ncbi:GntR family transcriptional regulator [Beijerinckia sp. L45]|uniref:GntR family transcriptional regulator n=1 Tax=Beijerinckia sp. L45 TaxID=1641855 RepID=UPI00131C9AF3|nr:GntR family transcriptional regulator [Beijerinckia sp. L45]